MRNTKTTLLHHWFEEVWNQNREDSIDKLMAAATNTHGITSEGQPNGAAGFKIFYNGFKEQFDNIQIDVQDVVAQDDMECARMQVTARHRETNKVVNFSGMCMVRVQDGQIAEAWNQYDFLSLYQQLGHTLTPQSAA